MSFFSLSLEQIAALGVLIANGIFVIVAVAAYLRMNGQEDRRQRFLSHALGDNREAGIALRSLMRDLQRLLERVERAALGRNSPAQDSGRGSPSVLPGDSSLPGGEDEQTDFARLSPPEHCPSIGDYAEWRRQQQVETARLLQQRRQLLQALDQARAAAARRTPGESRGAQRAEGLELQRMRQRVSDLQAELERGQVERAFVEERLLSLDEQLSQERARSAGLQGRVEALERAAVEDALA